MDEIVRREKFRAKLSEGFELTFQKLLAFKRYKKTPLVVVRNGKIVEISAEEVEREMKESKKAKSYKAQEKIQLVNEPTEKNPQKRKN